MEYAVLTVEQARKLADFVDQHSALVLTKDMEDMLAAVAALRAFSSTANVILDPDHAEMDGDTIIEIF